MTVEPQWRIAVDTGGTFTDCLGVDRTGRRVRAKVLSSGGLRLPVSSLPSAREIVVDSPDLFADGFFAGWRVEVDDRSIPVLGSSGNRLALADEVEGARWDLLNEVVLNSPDDPTVLAVRLVTGTAPGSELPLTDLRLATTRGTNALLERSGAKVALFVTRGFADVLEIGTQQRPDLFTLEIRKPRPLCETVVEVCERLDASGEIVTELDENALLEASTGLVSEGFDTAAVAFMHSYRNAEHEIAAARVLKSAGFRHVSCSSDLSRRIKFLPRTQTALVDAYLAEIVGGYLEAVAEGLRSRKLLVMTSAGALVRGRDYRPKDSLLSGPAAGVVGAVAAGRRSGRHRILAFDMGGTSTDVSRFDGELELQSETVVAQVRLLSPCVAVETVAAGGGSICAWRSGRILVGPESAGARPGPACYGDGGPLTVTDVNLLLGRLVPSRFPFRVDSEAAVRRSDELEARLLREEGSGSRVSGRESLLGGLLAIANERMAGAIRAISLRRGYDPTEYTLVAFGGAGPQHAARMAELLGMREVLIPEEGALLSAAGLLAGRLERWAELQVLEPLEATARHLPQWIEELRTEAQRELEAEGVAAERIEGIGVTAFLRYRGQESALAVPWAEDSSPRSLLERFEALYRTRYGYLPEQSTVELESLRVSMRSTSAEVGTGVPDGPAEDGAAKPNSAQRFWDGEDWVEVPVYERAELVSGRRAGGPCLIAESHTVTVVETGWRARVDRAGGLLLERES